MAYNLGGINYTVDADTSGIDRANESMEKAAETARDTGRAIDGVGDSSKKTSRDLKGMETDLKATTDGLKNGVLAATAFVGSLALISRNSAQAARELQNMAMISNTSVEEFQRLAFSAQSAGISSEQLGQIFLDVQDRVGDFLNTGGGEMADYFENIAPLVGQTAEQFRNLSGPQALQLFQQGLQQANLSAAEQRFYMESIASDATRLIPLLRDGGRGFEEMGQKADEAGVVLSQMQIDNLVDIDKAFNQLGTTIARTTDAVIADNAPAIIDAINGVIEAMTSATRFIDENIESIQAVATVLGTAAGAYAAYRAAVIAATVAQTAFNVAARANPIGLLITAAGAALGVLATFSDRTNSIADGVGRITDNLRGMTAAQREAFISDLQEQAIRKQIELTEAQEEYNKALAETDASAGGRGRSPQLMAQGATVQRLTNEFNELTTAIANAKEQQKNLTIEINKGNGTEVEVKVKPVIDKDAIPDIFSTSDGSRYVDDAFSGYIDNNLTPELSKALGVATEEGTKDLIESVPSDFAMSVGNALASQDYSSFANILASQAAGSIGTAVTDAVGGSLGGVAGGLVGGAAGAVISQSISDYMADDLIALERQANQGTGTVLGSIDAKSQSIANSLSYMSEGLDDLIGVNTDGFKAIQALSDSLTGASNLIARDFDTSGIATNLGLSSLGGLTQDFGGIVDDFFGGLTSGLFENVFGSIGGALFGKSSVSDQGVNLLSGTIAELIENDVTQAYQTVTKKSLFGSSRSESYRFAGDAIEQQFDLTLEAMRDAVTTSAESLGMLPSEIQANLDAFTIEAQKISIKDLSAEEVADELEAVFSSIFDGLAAAVVPYVDDFQEAGEGAGETLSRLSTNLAVVDEMLAQLRLSDLQGTTQEMLTLSEGIVDFFGDASSLASAFTGFVDEFATQERQLEILTGNLTDALGDQDSAILKSRDGVYDYIASLDQLDGDNVERIANILSLTDSIDEYFDLLESVNESAADYTDLQIRLAEAQDNDALATRLTREQEYADAIDDTARGFLTAIYAAEDYADSISEVSRIMNERLSDAVSETDSIFRSLTNAINEQKEEINERYESESEALRKYMEDSSEAIAELESAANSLRNAIKNVVDESAAVSMSRLRAARQEISALVSSGVIPDNDVLNELLSTVTGDNAQYYRTAEEYYYEQGKTANDIAKLSLLADDQLSEAEKLQEVNELQLNELTEIKDSNLNALDEQIEYWQDQIDISRGTYDAVMSVEEAIRQLEINIEQEQQAQSDVDKIDKITDSPNQTQSYTNQDILDGVAGVHRAFTVNGVLDWDAAERQIALEAIAKGISSERLAEALGVSQQRVLDRAAELGVPAFANGGTHTGGFMKMGEIGTEIANMPAGTHITTAQDTRKLLDQSPTIAAIDTLTERVRIMAGDMNSMYNLFKPLVSGNMLATSAYVENK